MVEREHLSESQTADGEILGTSRRVIFNMRLFSIRPWGPSSLPRERNCTERRTTRPLCRVRWGMALPSLFKETRGLGVSSEGQAWEFLLCGHVMCLPGHSTRWAENSIPCSGSIHLFPHWPLFSWLWILKAGDSLVRAKQFSPCQTSIERCRVASWLVTCTAG